MSQPDTSGVTSPSEAVPVPVSAPPTNDTQATATPEYFQMPGPLPTKLELKNPLFTDACARGLWQKAYDWHQQHGLHADHSVEGKSTELLVRYMMQERGFEEEAARVAVSIYPAHVLAKLHREKPSGMPTVGPLRAASDEEWEEKSRQ